jgi:AraC-like DNA-binding protein
MSRSGKSVSTDGGGLEAWRQIISESFVPLEARQLKVGDFFGEVLQHSLGPILLTHLSANASSVHRTPRLIKMSSEELFLVTMHAEGSGQVQQDGRLATQHIGDLVAYDTTRPYKLVFDNHRMIILQVPAAHLRRVLAMGDQVARTISAQEPAARILRAFLAELLKVAPDLDDDQREHFGTTALELLITAFSTSATRATSPEAVLAKIHSYIAGHISDPDLTVSRLAEVAGVSTRHLSRLFTTQGTPPGQYVLDARLDGARRMLADPRYDNLTVASIGHRVGVLDPTVFGRAFRRKFGVSPSELRMSSRSPRC